ncbi:MAG: hypothetical protein ACQCN6_02825 [Candidatus Bathyarchaeia archaeon]|jgi:hypothetical protein
MRRSLAYVLIVIVIFSSLAAVSIMVYSNSNKEFYVGVTYCGDSVDEAKQLIDKVKDYTNLFILDSGSLQTSGAAINETGDYAVAAGLNFMVYQGINSGAFGYWLPTYDGRWGNHFLGVYAIDEPGGKMLDGQINLSTPESPIFIIKQSDGSLSGYKIDDHNSVTYMRNGSVQVQPGISEPYYSITYNPNGTLIGTKYEFKEDGIKFTDTPLPKTYTLEYTYDELWAAYPIKNAGIAKQYYLSPLSDQINSSRQQYNSTLNIITADYGLYWYDYLSGYDCVLAQLGWNQTTNQDIALVRGAANAQGKDWGTIITWKYNHAPYLDSGDEIYDQMRLSYEGGAKYVAIFNYAPDMTGPYGTLQDEHFDALQRFWNDVKDGNIKQGEVKADTAFVLPPNYGSGLRNPEDIIWGLWTANETDSQIWQHMQDALSVYGEKLDIVYEDSAYPVAGKYSQVIYWNQTGS